MYSRIVTAAWSAQEHTIPRSTRNAAWSAQLNTPCLVLSETPREVCNQQTMPRSIGANGRDVGQRDTERAAFRTTLLINMRADISS